MDWCVGYFLPLVVAFFTVVVISYVYGMCMIVNINGKKILLLKLMVIWLSIAIVIVRPKAWTTDGAIVHIMVDNTYRIHCSIDSVARAAFYAYPNTIVNTSSDLETVDVSWITWVNCSFRMKAISSLPPS